MFSSVTCVSIYVYSVGSDGGIQFLIDGQVLRVHDILLSSIYLSVNHILSYSQISRVHSAPNYYRTVKQLEFKKSVWI